MKKIILAGFLLVGAVSLQAATPFQQDTTMHKKAMQHKKMMADSNNHKMKDMHHGADSVSQKHPMYKNKKKTDGTGTKQ